MPRGGPHAIAAADVDNDSDADLAVANYDSNNVTILRNAGDGSFVPGGLSGGSVADFCFLWIAG